MRHMVTREMPEKIEVYVERDTLEIIASAAMEYTYHWSLVEDWKQEKVVAAVKALQVAVKRNDFDAPLNTARL